MSLKPFAPMLLHHNKKWNDRYSEDNFAASAYTFEMNNAPPKAKPIRATHSSLHLT